MDPFMEIVMHAMAGPNGETAIAFIRNQWPNRNKGDADERFKTRGAILGALTAVRFVRGRGEHTHQCGHIDAEDTARSGLTAEDGCGYRWTHDEADINSPEAHDAAHTCPRCGKGPWFLQYQNKKGYYVLPDGGCSLRDPAPLAA